MKAQPEATEEAVIIAIYNDLIESWNRKSAGRVAFLFDENAWVVGFDGSQMNGRADIEIELGNLFVHRNTGTYVCKIREVRFLTKRVAMLDAVAGMIPYGEKNIKPEINAIQTMVVVRNKEEWKISLFQNTPAQFHGRPELAEALTAELRQLV
jgi:uncharacterized protein (TIGR02246 family)